jgi:hypothetical protein
VVVVVVVALTPGSAPHVVFVFPTEVPAGYTLDPAASGTMTEAAAAQITVADTTAVAAALHSDHFRTGQLRMWEDGSNTYIKVVVFAFRSGAEAEAFQSFQLNHAAALAGGGSSGRKAALSSPAALPGVTEFYAGGDQSSDSTAIFITGGWFVHGVAAYLVEVGSPYPQSNALATQLLSTETSLVASHAAD